MFAIITMLSCHRSGMPLGLGKKDDGRQGLPQCGSSRDLQLLLAGLNLNKGLKVLL